MTYSEIVREHQSAIIRRTNDDGSYSWIPKCVDNTDYQQYLAWLAEGNTPLPADEPAPAPEPTLQEKLASIGLDLNDLKEALR